MRMARESGRASAVAARDLGIHHETLRVWLRQDEADDGARPDRLSTAQREELALLRHAVRELRRANEILKAASAFFAREIDQPRPRRARSSTHIGNASGSSRSAGSSRSLRVPTVRLPAVHRHLAPRATPTCSVRCTAYASRATVSTASSRSETG